MIEAKMITTAALFRPHQPLLSPVGGNKFGGIHLNLNLNLNVNGGVMRTRRIKCLSSSSLVHDDTNSNSNSMLFLSDVASTITTEDDHGGVILDIIPSHHLIDPSLFTSLLTNSIRHWKQQGKKGVWIKLPIQLVNLIQPAVNQGFYFHHAEPTYLMLVHWIPQTPNTLPSNASHRVGVGAFVMKQDGQVLVVQEKGGKMRGTGVWKFPTGVVDEGEDICDAAVREVKEETGIDAKFVEILAFRQSHKKFFDKSDLFFMCMLEPLSFQIQKQDREIEAAQWMSFEEYAAQPFVKKHDLPKYVAEICLAKIQKYYNGFSHVPTITSFSKQQSNLYLNTNDLNSC